MVNVVMNGFCSGVNCKYYIEWEFEGNEYGSYICYSCTIVGQSYDITEIPNSCPYSNQAHKFKDETEKRLVWETLETGRCQG